MQSKKHWMCQKHCGMPVGIFDVNQGQKVPRMEVNNDLLDQLHVRKVLRNFRTKMERLLPFAMRTVKRFEYTLESFLCRKMAMTFERGAVPEQCRSHLVLKGTLAVLTT